MTEAVIDVGFVTAPSGVLVLDMAGWIDHWRELGQPLSERARAVAASGEAIFVRSCARRSPSPQMATAH
ncbi:hypothetical protein ACFYM5_03190 [Streptomyces sp. NPDC006706]|uniref:hypothetical protein n=1 Tax=Streptomyces sp. NPDC006706 TaxID=3364761 RepID=UPI0036C3BFED